MDEKQGTLQFGSVIKDFIEIETLVQLFRNDAAGVELYLLGEFEGEKNQEKRKGTGTSMQLSSLYSIVWDVNRRRLHESQTV